MIEADILFFVVFKKKMDAESMTPSGWVFAPEGTRPTALYFTKTTVLGLK